MLTFELLPPGLMRALIARIGDKAGLAAEYWRDGLCFYDRKTGARALVEQRYTIGWAGEIHVQTQRGQAQALLERLLEFIDNRHAPSARALQAAPSPPVMRCREVSERRANFARARTIKRNQILHFLRGRQHPGRRQTRAVC